MNANYSLTGQIFDANEQCKMIYGNDASFCHVSPFFFIYWTKNLNEKQIKFLSDKICNELYCRKSNDDLTCFAQSPAVEGTSCESGKVKLYPKKLNFNIIVWLRFA